MNRVTILLVTLVASSLCFASVECSLPSTEVDKIKRWGAIEDNNVGGLYGVPLILKINVKNIGEQPSWNTNDDNPPMSAKSAIQIATKFIGERLVDFPDAEWLITKITLLPLQASKGDVWCWQVSFTLQHEGVTTGHEILCGIYITMDGNIIEPQEDPWKGYEGKTIFRARK
ncbi:MAG: hypothetical protein ACK5YR_18390 [Pirellula sp.]